MQDKWIGGREPKNALPAEPSIEDGWIGLPTADLTASTTGAEPTQAADLAADPGASLVDPIVTADQQMAQWQEEYRNRCTIPDFHRYDPAQLVDTAERIKATGGRGWDGEELYEFDLAYQRAFGVSIEPLLDKGARATDAAVQKLIEAAVANTDLDRMLSIKEACELVGVDQSTIYRLRRAGEFVAEFWPTPDTVRFKAGDVFKWLDERKIDRSANRKRKG